MKEGGRTGLALDGGEGEVGATRVTVNVSVALDVTADLGDTGVEAVGKARDVLVVVLVEIKSSRG